MSQEINRRKFLAGSGALALSSVVKADTRPAAPDKQAASAPVTPASPTAPNVLWICTDQQRFDTIRSMGNEHINTPNLDRLCEQGTAFTQTFCQNPICTPSRGSFLTGRYPRSIRACQNGNDQWADAAPLITKTLSDAGYDCGLAGKFHLAGAQGRIEPRPDDGYRVFDWSHHPHDSWPEGHAYEQWLKAQGTGGHTQLKKEHGTIPAQFHQTTWCADRAIDFMREDHDGPWLFSFNCFDPHPPLDPPAGHLARFDIDSLPDPPIGENDLDDLAKLAPHNRFIAGAHEHKGRAAKVALAKYWAMIELIDDNVGRMLEALDESGQRENTLVIFTSDHGNMVGHHGLMAKGCAFYEGLVRVPLIVSMPGTVEAGRTCDALVELVDIAPTLLELAGMPADPEMHGRSLLPLLTGAANPAEHRDAAMCTYTNTIPVHERDIPAYGTMLRTHTHKLCMYHGAEFGQLFDLENDPGEMQNLWDDPAAQGIKSQLMLKSQDISTRTLDKGTPCTTRY